jgi:hypothetical protein
MTVQTAIIITQDYGASLGTPTLRNYLTDTLIVAADSANEVTADSGRYALVFDETSVHAAGWYGLRAFVSGAPINRFVYFTGVDGETAIAVSDLPPGLPQTGQVIVTRPVGDDTPITFSFPVASATLTGTRRINNAGSTTALSGARSFLRTSGTQHLYSLAYNAADRPTDDGVVEYVFTDGTYSRTVVLKAVTAVLDPAARVKLDATQPDYAPSTATALAAVDTKIGTPETSLSAMVGNVPTVAEFEARTIAAASYRQNISLRGSSMTEAKAFDLLLASLAGVTSQPSGTTEKFKFLDGVDAFTTTFDTNGNRTGVALD